MMLKMPNFDINSQDKVFYHKTENVQSATKKFPLPTTVLLLQKVFPNNKEILIELVTTKNV